MTENEDDRIDREVHEMFAELVSHIPGGDLILRLVDMGSGNFCLQWSETFIAHTLTCEPCSLLIREKLAGEIMLSFEISQDRYRKKKAAPGN